MSGIYLDNAATSFPKPVAVYDAVDRYQRELGTAVGRSGSTSAREVQTAVRQARAGVARLIHAESADRVIFTFNGTDSLNLALHGWLHPGDHVITTQWEHNSVLRPLRWLQKQRSVELTVLPPGADGRIDPQRVRAALRPETKLVAVIHASNVTGDLQPVADIADVCRSHAAVFLLDAAQTVGNTPIDVQQLGVDLLACPGHKGLLGPLGTGVLYIRTDLEHDLQPQRQGGTGSQSELDEQPSRLPDRYESGNLNAPGLVGLAAGVEYVLQTSVTTIAAREHALIEQFREQLWTVPGLTIYGRKQKRNPQDASAKNDSIGILSLNLDGWDPRDLATVLDDSFGVQTRAGLHCAPGAHRHLGTFDAGGTLRFSVGPLTTESDIDAAVEAIREIAGV